MVGIFDTNDNFALGMATSGLTEAGVIYDVVQIPELVLNEVPTNPKWWIPPHRILVAAEDEADACALIEPFKHPIGDREELGNPES